MLYKVLKASGQEIELQRHEAHGGGENFSVTPHRAEQLFWLAYAVVYFNGLGRTLRDHVILCDLDHKFLTLPRFIMRIPRVDAPERLHLATREQELRFKNRKRKRRSS